MRTYGISTGCLYCNVDSAGNHESHCPMADNNILKQSDTVLVSKQEKCIDCPLLPILQEILFLLKNKL